MHANRVISLVAALVLGATAPAATLYNEAVSGDLSNNGLAPTVLSVTAGANQILGTTGRATTSVDRDYFTITVPTGYRISRLLELAGTQAGGVSFFGIEAGTQLTLSVAAVTADGLLGWSHYAATASDTDLLPGIAIPSNGSSGFALLPAGQYSFWVQDFSPGTYSYAFDIELSQVPEPAAAVPCIASLVALLLWSRRRPSSKLTD